MKKVVVLVLALGLAGLAGAEDKAAEKAGHFPEVLGLQIEKTDLERVTIRQKLENMQLEAHVLQGELRAREEKIQALIADAAAKAKVDPQASELDLPNRAFRPKGTAPAPESTETPAQ